MKKRLDVYLVESGKFATREKAQLEIKNGSVCVDGKVATKPSLCVDENSKIEVVGEFLKYVSRAGLKIEKAQQFFNIDFAGKVVLDIGASTGGFTDFCLQNGAKKVFAVDVGTNQLHEKLRANPKVECIENTDIRTIKTLPEKIDIAVCDVSFISLTKIGEAVCGLLENQKHFMALIKPQFECGKEFLNKNGIVKNEKARFNAIKKVYTACVNLGMYPVNLTTAPIKEGKNVEYVIMLKNNDNSVNFSADELIRKIR